MAVFASGEPDSTLPSEDAIREAQEQAIREAQEQAQAGLGVMVAGARSFQAAVGRVSKDGEGLFRVHVAGRDVLWIPPVACLKSEQGYHMLQGLPSRSRGPWRLQQAVIQTSLVISTEVIKHTA